MSATERQRIAKRTRWAARIIGLVVIAFFLFMLIGEAITSIQAEGFELGAESLFVAVILAMALAGYIVSWRRELVGGSLLILVFVVFGIFPSIGAQLGWSMSQAPGDWFILISLFLVTGALFLISWWFSREKA